jgi:hypothetical protein
MNNINSTDKPLNVFAWVTIWERETIVASIAHDKVHVVERTVSSNNRESGVVDPNAKRTEGFRAVCGTTRRGRYFAVASDAVVTCAKCAKIAR